MPRGPTTVALVLIRTICRLMALHGTKVTDQRLASIPNLTQVTTYGEKLRWGGRQSNRDKSRPLVDIGIWNVLLPFDILNLAKIRTNTFNISSILLIRIIKNVEDGNRRTSAKDRAPQSKKPYTSIFHGIPPLLWRKLSQHHNQFGLQ